MKTIIQLISVNNRRDSGRQINTRVFTYIIIRLEYEQSSFRHLGMQATGI